MKTATTQQESISEIKRQQIAKRNTIIVMALLFIALISGGGATSSPNEALSARDLIWGGLTVIAFGSLVWALYIAYKLADERQQLIQLKATSMTFAAVIFSLVTAQMLHALDVASLTISIQVIVIGGILLWVTLMKAVERRSD